MRQSHSSISFAAFTTVETGGTQLRIPIRLLTRPRNSIENEEPRARSPARAVLQSRTRVVLQAALRESRRARLPGAPCFINKKAGNDEHNEQQAYESRHSVAGVARR
jgi:hypothetical protein